MGGEDPSYQAATDHNLVSQNGGWSQGETTVDADLDGMADFVANMVTLQDNLKTHGWYFTEVSELPSRGLGVKGYEEGVDAMLVLNANAAEFQQYFQFLQQAHMNIAMGGQTCIDAMGGKDDLNGISLNAVNFALAVAGTKQPPGLAPGLAKQLGETWQDVHAKQLADQAATGSGGGQASIWTKGGAGPPPTPGMTTVTMTDQYGNTRVIMTSDDKTTTIVTETSADGKNVTNTETVKTGGMVTTTITRQENLGTPKEKSTTTTSTTTTQHSDHSTVTTTTGANGKPTSQESVVQSRDGTTTTTETTYDDKGKEHDDPGVTVGHERPDPKMPKSPVPAAMKSIR